MAVLPFSHLRRRQRAQALDDFEEHGGAVAQRLGEDLQQHALQERQGLGHQMGQGKVQEQVKTTNVLA